MEIPKEYTYDDKPKPKVEYTSNMMQSSMSPSKQTMKKNQKFRNGDLVDHSVYGQGVVLKIEGNVATVAFSHKFGVKKLNASHPSLKKA